MLHLLLVATADPTNGLLDFLQKGGVLGILALALIGGSRRWWVFGWTYRDLEQDRDQWKQIALSGTHVAERAVNAVERSTAESRRRKP